MLAIATVSDVLLFFSTRTAYTIIKSVPLYSIILRRSFSHKKKIFIFYKDLTNLFINVNYNEIYFNLKNKMYFI